MRSVPGIDALLVNRGITAGRIGRINELVSEV
jgi:hypothetical protein